MEKAGSLSEQQADQPSLARASQLLGNTLWGLGDYAGSLVRYRRALDLYRALGDAEGEAKVLGNIGNTLHSMGDYPQALTYLNQSLQAGERLGLPSGKELLRDPPLPYRPREPCLAASRLARPSEGRGPASQGVRGSG